jgi:hypothetical protein
MRGLSALVLGGVLTCACGHPREPSPASSQIEVRLASARADALKQTRKALQDEGFEVDPPLRHDSVLSTNRKPVAQGIFVEYRAIVHFVDSASSVVALTGIVFNQHEAQWDMAFLGIPKRKETPLTKDARGDEQLGWTKMQQIANRLRTDPPAP